VNFRRAALTLATLAVAAAALTGCTGGGASAVPDATGDATEYASATELRDAFIAAGGTCDQWEPLDPGDYDADAGRCSDTVVIAVYSEPAELDAAVERAQNLAVQTHLLVGENWMLNIENPQDYVDALGGTTVS
jgi:hypothetical protein